MTKEIIDLINGYDPEIAAATQAELNRQQCNLELIASENIVSEAVLAATGTMLTNKYAEGYPAHRYYGGCEYVDVVENIAIERAKKLFNAKFANVQPHSGSQANAAVYLALLTPGDTVMGMNINHGGHLTHGAAVNMSGKYFDFHGYGVDDDGYIDYDLVRKQAKEVKPKMIVAGASAYPRAIKFDVFADIAKEVGALLFVDMAHIAGLVAGGMHQSPLPYADVVSTTTHKTLRGPRGGMILSNNEEIGKKINKAIFPGMQGGPLMHVIAAKAICFKEALEDSYKVYQKQVITNAKALADNLMSEGIKLVSNGTDNHLMLIDLKNSNVTGKELEIRLDSVNITANKNSVPNDPQKATITSGVRIGTPAITSRGLTESDMKIIAHLISETINNHGASANSVRASVRELCERYPIYSK